MWGWVTVGVFALTLKLCKIKLQVENIYVIKNSSICKTPINPRKDFTLVCCSFSCDSIKGIFYCKHFFLVFTGHMICRPVGSNSLGHDVVGATKSPTALHNWSKVESVILNFWFLNPYVKWRTITAQMPCLPSSTSITHLCCLWLAIITASAVSQWEQTWQNLEHPPLRFLGWLDASGWKKMNFV